MVASIFLNKIIMRRTPNTIIYKSIILVIKPINRITVPTPVPLYIRHGYILWITIINIVPLATFFTLFTIPYRSHSCGGGIRTHEDFHILLAYETNELGQTTLLR